MTSVLAPSGIGLWGQNLRFTGAVGVRPTIPSDEYNRNSLGQRGGTVVTPIADVGGSAGGSASSRDPFNKQTATLIVRDEPKPRTLRDGFSGGEASFERGGIVTPVARTVLTEAEVAARLKAEGKSTRPASATPVSLNDAIALLKSAEETWPAEGDPELDQGYQELVADAKRLKIIKGATLRRTITADEQDLVTQIASKYAAALGEQSSEAVGAERAAAAEDARPANEAASAAAAEKQVEGELAEAAARTEELERGLRSAIAKGEAIRKKGMILTETLKVRGAQLDAAIARGDKGAQAKIMASIKNATDAQMRQQDQSREEIQTMMSDRANTLLAAESMRDRREELRGFVAEPSYASMIRKDISARFAPHDRERQQQALALSRAIAPQFERAVAPRFAEAQRRADRGFQQILREVQDSSLLGMEDAATIVEQVQAARDYLNAQIPNADTLDAAGRNVTEVLRNVRKMQQDAESRAARLEDQSEKQLSTVMYKLGELGESLGEQRRGSEAIASVLVDRPLRLVYTEGNLSRGRVGPELLSALTVGEAPPFRELTAAERRA